MVVQENNWGKDDPHWQNPGDSKGNDGEQKELEISYLRNQLQVYKHMLLDVGINDCDIADETIATNIPLSESKSVENPCHNIKRNFSPTLQLNKLFADIDIKKMMEQCNQQGAG
jgi:hypothetical protein